MTAGPARAGEVSGAARRPNLIAPLPAHRLDEAALFAYLGRHLDGFCEPISLSQFQGGQSNPTYLITTTSSAYVLRKKPPGDLLPSAHQIDREYRVQSALAGSDVPVATMLHACEDRSVIGAEFYVMAYVEGRILVDVLMPDLTPAARRQVQTQMFETLGALHSVDFTSLGLSDYGRPANYIQRQISRWRRQSEMLATDPIPYMTQLMDWLATHAPSGDETSLVHGDFRLGNLMMHPTEPRILAVLDWELSTLGHPLADVAYSCTVFHTPQGYGPHYSGYAGVDLDALGLMSEAQCLEIYCRRAGRDAIANWTFYLGFSMLRSAGIAHGVYARALAGNAADTSAKDLHRMAKATAELGWALVSRAPQ